MTDPALLLAQLVILPLATRMGGTLAVRARQPRVVGELLAGLALGPSLLGALINARSLMAIVVATIGFDAGVISAACFNLLVLMALATTAMTGPLLAAFGAPPGALATPRPGE